MIQIKKKFIAYAFICLAVFDYAFALPSDRQQPLSATSRQAELHKTTLTGIYTGDVHAVQGSTSLNSDVLTIQLNEAHQVKSAVADGHPAVYTTTIKPSENPLIAKANHIEYYPRQHLVILLGDGFVTRNKDTYSSQTIYYDTVSQEVRSPKEEGQRTTIVIQPKNQKS